MGAELRLAMDGARESLPLLPAIVPFAALFGALATAAGLSPGEVVLASASIYAGASQYAMLDLMGQRVPAWSILLAVFAINARHLLYSAAISRRLSDFGPLQRALAFFMLADPQFAAAERRARTTGRLEPVWYFGYGIAVYGCWVSCAALGILFGDMLGSPADWGLDLVLPAYFVALVMTFRNGEGFWSLVAVSATCGWLSFNWFGTPWHILVGASCGIAWAALRAGDETVPPDEGVTEAGSRSPRDSRTAR